VVQVGPTCCKECPSVALGHDELGSRPGWWEFAVSATNTLAAGPQSLPSLPLLVLPDPGGKLAGCKPAASRSMPSTPAESSIRPALDLSGVTATAIATIAKLFSGVTGTPAARRGSFDAGLFGVRSEPSVPERASFSIAAEHESSVVLNGQPADAVSSHVLDELLNAAAESRFPLRARSRQVYEWPVRGQFFKHGPHRVEMSIASLYGLMCTSLRMPDAEAPLPAQLRKLELLPMIVLHAVHEERAGRLVLEAEPTHMLTDVVTEAPTEGSQPTQLEAPRMPPSDGGSGVAAGGGANDNGGGAAFHEPPPMPRARALKRAATVPLKLDDPQGSTGCDEVAEHERTLRSLEFTRLRLLLEVVSDGGVMRMRIGLAAGLRLELPTPWFVPRAAIETAGNLLLKVGLKMACDQLLREIEWLDSHEAREQARLNRNARLAFS